MTESAVAASVGNPDSEITPASALNVAALRRRVFLFANLLYVAPLPLWIAALWAGEVLHPADTPRYLLTGSITIVPFTVLFFILLERIIRRAFAPAMQLAWDCESDLQRSERDRISSSIAGLPGSLMRGQVAYGLLAPPVAALGYAHLAAEPLSLNASWLLLELMALLVVVIPAIVLLHNLSRMLAPVIERIGVQGLLNANHTQLRQQMVLSAIGVPMLTLLLVVSLTLQREELAPFADWSLAALAIVVALACLYGVWAINQHFGDSLGAVRRVAETGDLSVTIPIRAIDEFGVMAAEFNRMLRRLQETEQGRSYLESLLASVGDALLVVNAGYRIVRANSVAADWWGCADATELIGRPVAELFVNDPTKLQNSIGQCLGPEPLTQTLDVTIGEQDHARTARLTLSSVTDNRHAGAGCLVLARDMTQEVKHYRALAASEARYRALAENSAAAIYQINLDGEIEYANRTLRQMVSGGSGNAVTTRVTDFLSSSDQALVMRNLSLRSQGEATSYELGLKTASGETRRMLTSGAPLKSEDGTVVGSVGMMIDVSDLAEARRQRRASEAKYRALAETNAAGIYQVEPDGTLIYCNAAMANLLGADTPDPLIATNILDMMVPESRVRVARDRSLRERGLTSSYEVELINLRQEVRRLSLHGAPVLDADGHYRSAIGVAIDITEQVEVREQLLANEARFRALAETSGAAIMQMDYEGAILYANEAARDLFGMHDRGGLGNYDWHSFIPENAVAGIDNELHRRRRGFGSTYQIELNTRGGERRQMLVSGAPVKDEDGENRSAITVMVDVTDREQAQAALRDSESKYRALAETAVAGIWQIDSSGRTLYVNPAMRQMLEINDDTPLETLNINEFMSETDIGVTTEQHQQRASGVGTANYEITLIGRNGTKRDVLVSGAGIYDENETLASLVGSFIDVTELHSALNTIRNQIAELETKNRELEEFNYVASHDLQEPLRTIISFGELLREDLGDAIGDQAAEDLNFITGGAERLRVLVQDLLELSRSGRRRLDENPVLLNDCVTAALADLRRFVEESGAEVSYGDLPPVRGNARALTRVFTNLISNGVKFADQEQPRVIISAAITGDRVQVSIRDNGIGISEEYLEQIFQPFKRLHSRSRYEGSGIGLAICQRLIESHGGTIWAESDGRGSDIHFTLPLAPDLTGDATGGKNAIDQSMETT